MLQETNELSNCPVHHCVSLLITSFHKSGSKKKTNKQLELHIKILIIIPIFFFLFLFLVWTEHIQCHQVLFFKVREYKVIRTLDTNKKKRNMFREHVFILYHFSSGGKVLHYTGPPISTSFPCKPQEPPSVSESLAKTPSKEWTSLSGLKNIIHNLFYTAKTKSKVK